ncbi:MAG: stage II sporulation protein M [Romboutsia sp.]
MNNLITTKKIVFFIFLISFIFSFLINFLFKFNKGTLLISNTTNLNSFELFSTILIKNTICFLIILSSIFISKYIVYIFLFINGYNLGAIISQFTNVKHFLLIIPHGVTEIYSFLFLSVITLKILKFEYISPKDKRNIIFSFLILLLSAFIEAFITPYIYIKFVIGG